MPRPLPLPIAGVVLAQQLERAAGREAGLASLAGRLVELSATQGGALLTCATALVLEAQRQAIPCAWMTRREASFYPPDLQRSGVDLGALVVVRSGEVASLFRAAAHLLRSGAFGLVVLDLVGALSGPRRVPEVPMPLLARVTKLASKHAAAAVCLTAKPPEAPSLGSLVSLRAVSQASRRAPGSFRVALGVTKDKLRAPGIKEEEVVCGPPGLR